jgi:hypothetical protein
LNNSLKNNGQMLHNPGVKVFYIYIYFFLQMFEFFIHFLPAEC